VDVGSAVSRVSGNPNKVIHGRVNARFLYLLVNDFGRRNIKQIAQF
jgi:hypothetical protein